MSTDILTDHRCFARRSKALVSTRLTHGSPLRKVCVCASEVLGSLLSQKGESSLHAWALSCAAQMKSSRVQASPSMQRRWQASDCPPLRLLDLQHCPRS